MTLATKLSKNVTALMFDGWVDGYRYIGGILKTPKRGAEKESFMVLLGHQLVINKDILDKYGIEITVKGK